ncbi:MAG: hypothetical protein RI884_3030 [Pseudomonadota bacterium]|jgi:hypothetical protein
MKQRLEKHMTFPVNAVEPALPGHRRCPLGGETAEGRFGGES